MIESMKSAAVSAVPEIRLKATVCFFIKHSPALGWLVYLIIKGRKIGKGKRLGYGGNFHGKETARVCTKREVFEETGTGIIVKPENLKYVALGEFITIEKDGSKKIVRINVFLADKWSGGEDFFPTEEAYGGQWYPIDKIPLSELMLADKEWLKTVLENNVGGKSKSYLIEAVYGPGQQTLLRPVVMNEVHQLTVD